MTSAFIYPFRLVLAVLTLFSLGALSSNSTAALPAAVDGQPLPSLAPILAEVTPAVVNIHTETRVRVSSPLLNDPFFRYFFDLPSAPRERVQSSLGSGVIVDAERGYVLTNHHVIEGADGIAVTLDDGRNFEAQLIGSDPDTDVAVIQIEADDLSALGLADSQQLQVGDFVVAVGNPFGLGQTVTSGIVSALGRSALSGLALQNFIQTDASINPGNSGGALVNLRGELVGINTAIFTPSGGNVGIGFAIPSSMVQQVMEQLLRFGEVRRGTLGLEVQDLTPDLARAFDIEKPSGVVVTQVWGGTPAAESGLRAGDIIVKAGGQTIKRSQDLRNAEGLVPVGENIALEYLRGGKTRNTQVPITAQEDIIVEGKSLDRRFSGAEFVQRSRKGDRDNSWVAISHVEPGSYAERQGLVEGDIVLGINRRRVETLSQLGEVVQQSSQRQRNQRRRALVMQIQRGRYSYLVTLE
jgi:Do/DeqQ family serine protease